MTRSPQSWPDSRAGGRRRRRASRRSGARPLRGAQRSALAMRAWRSRPRRRRPGSGRRCPAAADPIEVDAERGRGLEQACALRSAPLAGGREDDAMGQEFKRSFIQSPVGPSSLSAREAGSRAPPCPETPSRPLWTPAFAGVAHGAVGAQLARQAGLLPVVLGKRPQRWHRRRPRAGRPRPRLRFRDLSARHGLASPHSPR